MGLLDQLFKLTTLDTFGTHLQRYSELKAAAGALANAYCGGNAGVRQFNLLALRYVQEGTLKTGRIARSEKLFWIGGAALTAKLFGHVYFGFKEPVT